MNNIEAQSSTPTDFSLWLNLAREVEPFFGPMVDDAIFQEGMKQSIREGRAICVKMKEPALLLGGIIIDLQENKILWLAVTQTARGKGIGHALMDEALNRLDAARPVRVQTFDQSVPAGLPARKLYLRYGFVDKSPGGPNPAGIPTVIMQKPGK